MARKPITQRIALEGGEDFRAGLRSLGEEGQKAFKSIKDGAESVKSGTDGLSTNLTAIEGQARTLGQSLRDLGGNFRELGVNLAKVATAAAAVGTALFGVTNSAAKAADESRDNAASLGLSIQEYGRLNFALKQSGSSAEGARQALTTFSDLVVKTRDDTSKTGTVLTRLGVQVRGAGENGLRPFEAIMGDISDRFKALPDGATKTALAIELFGKRAGPQLIPLLNEGRNGIKALGDEAERLGGVFSKAQGELGDSFGDALGRLSTAFQGLKNTIGLIFAQDFVNIFDGITELIVRNRQAIIDVATAIRTGLVTAFNGLKAVAVPVFQAIFVAIQQLVNAFNAIFGTNITAQQVIVVAAFAAIAAAVLVLVKTIALAIPGLTSILAVLTGIPAIIAVVKSAFAALVGTFAVIVNAARLLALVFGGIPLLIATIVAAIAVFVATNEQARNAIAQGWATVWNGIRDGAIALYDAITSAFNGLIEFFATLFTSLTDTASGLWNGLVQGAESARQGIINAFQTAVDNVTGFFRGLYDSVVSIFDQIIAKAKEVIRAVSDSLSGGASGGSGSDSAPGFARGGYVRGPGSTKSDSILALLSDQEFVHNARAVKHYGLGFMRSVNDLTFPRFNMGGLVESMSSLIPRGMRFAEGGLVGAAAGASGGASYDTPVIFDLNNKLIGPFMTGPDILNQLKGEAVRRTLSPRKPNWMK